MQNARFVVMAFAVVCAFGARVPGARADLPSNPLPPWSDPGDLPIPTWARSVAPKRPARGAQVGDFEVPVFAAPGRVDLRRGTILGSAGSTAGRAAIATTRLGLYAAKRAPGCSTRWLNVGPLAWVCGELAELSPDAPTARTSVLTPLADGLPFRYFFVGKDGASGFERLESALDDPPDQELDPGFVVGIVEERQAHGERWGRTNHGRWVALRELSAVRPPGFHGEPLVDGALDVAWVNAERAVTYGAPPPKGRKTGARVRFQLVHVYAVDDASKAARVSADGAETTEWIALRDLARPTIAGPPEGLAPSSREQKTPRERWIDVDASSQTLVAYDGEKPVYATMVSTGRPGPDTATPKGSHRVWVKLATTNMDNLEKEDADQRYAIEDVPYVQFFDKGVALHAAFWHHDFGRVHSHGCVNLAPLDAAWLFAFTEPHLPAGWTAVLPTATEKGTLVRVR